ncbi:MAG: phosphoribosylformylglycinamidine synthase [bacterium]
MLHFYRNPALTDSERRRFVAHAATILKMAMGSLNVATEWCFCVETKNEVLAESGAKRLMWLLRETFEPDRSGTETTLSSFPTVLMTGPRLNFETPFSSQAVAICQACGLDQVVRLERFLRFGLSVENMTGEQEQAMLASWHDRMTQMPYRQLPDNLDSGLGFEPVSVIPVLRQGKKALQRASREMGLGFDEQDIDKIYHLFITVLKRNPTDVELLWWGNAMSEHSRHLFFKGELVIGGVSQEHSLMEIVQAPWKARPGNSVLAFSDDSSAIQGCEITRLVPSRPGYPCQLGPVRKLWHPTLTAETHNHPTAFAPYPGAETGTGGRIRDNNAVARGGLVGVGGAAYCTGNLCIPDYDLPWERDSWQLPVNMASPLQIMIRASDGASDYGNCFGEPVIYGFVRTCDLSYAGARYGWLKPIMYSVGAGLVAGEHLESYPPGKGMIMLQIGGLAYRIGVGGGSASSMTAGANTEELDFASVQRGDARMENVMDRVLRACIAMGSANPILSAGDLGAGGSGNLLTELAYPAGARVELRYLPSGDSSLSPGELWMCEAQERNGILIGPDQLPFLQQIADREGVLCVKVGSITGDGWMRVHDSQDGTYPFALPLEDVLGESSRKIWHLDRPTAQPEPLVLPDSLTVKNVLDRVLRLPAVGSKRFLTTKVDRSVAGLVVQQQCVGPNHVTLCGYAVKARSHLTGEGDALSLGEKPMIGLINPAAMARMAVAEALLNMVGARITALEDVRFSANWMLAAKLPGEGARLYDAARSLRDICLDLSIAPDGGKDSLSMAVKVVAPDGKEKVMKAPMELVIAAYAGMPHAICKVTPELKKAGNGLLLVDLSGGKCRLGGSALAQVYGQVGDECPDVENVALLELVFRTVQQMQVEGWISSVHDRSDGGLITTLLEMAFAGNLGLDINYGDPNATIPALFGEELGLVIEISKPQEVMQRMALQGIPVCLLGMVTDENRISVILNGSTVLDEPMTDLRAIWEATSTAIDYLQANPECVDQEAAVNQSLLTPPPYCVTFDCAVTLPSRLTARAKPQVAILRERGSNGDVEMAAAFYAAGFEPWDVTITDLIAGRISLDQFKCMAFVGGFSFGDVLDAAKGWAGVSLFNDCVREEFAQFRARDDTISFGVCNGCQLMTLLGWVIWPDLADEAKPRFVRNRSGRFESRFPAVKVMPSPAIMLRGMEESILGVHTAHGEGRLHVPRSDMLRRIIDVGLAPLRYVDREGEPTEVYPFNPNGSPQGITALCSPDGRHLAMMPHPERTFQKRLWPWMPSSWQGLPTSPWMKLFQNAYDWCVR